MPIRKSAVRRLTAPSLAAADWWRQPRCEAEGAASGERPDWARARVLLTGEIEVNLVTRKFRLTYVPDLVACKLAGAEDQARIFHSGCIRSWFENDRFENSNMQYLKQEAEAGNIKLED